MHCTALFHEYLILIHIFSPSGRNLQIMPALISQFFFTLEHGTISIRPPHIQFLRDNSICSPPQIFIPASYPPNSRNQDLDILYIEQIFIPASYPPNSRNQDLDILYIEQIFILASYPPNARNQDLDIYIADIHLSIISS